MGESAPGLWTLVEHLGLIQCCFCLWPVWSPTDWKNMVSIFKNINTEVKSFFFSNPWFILYFLITTFRCLVIFCLPHTPKIQIIFAFLLLIQFFRCLKTSSTWILWVSVIFVRSLEDESRSANGAVVLRVESGPELLPETLTWWLSGEELERLSWRGNVPWGVLFSWIKTFEILPIVRWNAWGITAGPTPLPETNEAYKIFDITGLKKLKWQVFPQR